MNKFFVNWIKSDKIYSLFIQLTKQFFQFLSTFYPDKFFLFTFYPDKKFFYPLVIWIKTFYSLFVWIKFFYPDKKSFIHLTGVTNCLSTAFCSKKIFWDVFFFCFFPISLKQFLDFFSKHHPLGRGWFITQLPWGRIHPQSRKKTLIFGDFTTLWEWKTISPWLNFSFLENVF